MSALQKYTYSISAGPVIDFHCFRSGFPYLQIYTGSQRGGGGRPIHQLPNSCSLLPQLMIPFSFGMYFPIPSLTTA